MDTEIDLNAQVSSFQGRTKTVAEWIEAQEITDVHSRIGDWVITSYGLECLCNFYPIEAARLWEGEGYYGWERHMSEKRWVDLPNFLEALEAAREHHSVTSK